MAIVKTGSNEQQKVFYLRQEAFNNRPRSESFGTIDPNMLREIFRWLGLADICSARLTCQHWVTHGHEVVTLKLYEATSLQIKKIFVLGYILEIRLPSLDSKEKTKKATTDFIRKKMKEVDPKETASTAFPDLVDLSQGITFMSYGLIKAGVKEFGQGVNLEKVAQDLSNFSNFEIAETEKLGDDTLLNFKIEECKLKYKVVDYLKQGESLSDNDLALLYAEIIGLHGGENLHSNLQSLCKNITMLAELCGNLDHLIDVEQAEARKVTVHESKRQQVDFESLFQMCMSTNFLIDIGSTMWFGRTLSPVQIAGRPIRGVELNCLLSVGVLSGHRIDLSIVDQAGHIVLKAMTRSIRGICCQERSLGFPNLRISSDLKGEGYALRCSIIRGGQPQGTPPAFVFTTDTFSIEKNQDSGYVQQLEDLSPQELVQLCKDRGYTDEDLKGKTFIQLIALLDASRD